MGLIISQGSSYGWMPIWKLRAKLHKMSKPKMIIFDG